MRIIFFGTPDFAVPSLQALLGASHEVVAVVTQPDRPSGRGQKFTSSPVKQAAERLGLPLFQPERVRRPEAVSILRDIPVDAMVVVGYGQIIPQSIIDMAPLGIINVHGSLLPKYRGAGPIQWSIVNGEAVTGVTTMRIDAGLDSGPVCLQEAQRLGHGVREEVAGDGHSDTSVVGRSPPGLGLCVASRARRRLSARSPWEISDSARCSAKRESSLARGPWMTPLPV